jgi:hypothetical protein
MTTTLEQGSSTPIDWYGVLNMLVCPKNMPSHSLYGDNCCDMISKEIGCPGVMTTLCHALASMNTRPPSLEQCYSSSLLSVLFCVNEEILLYFSLLLGSPIHIACCCCCEFAAMDAFHGKIEKSQ